MWITKFDPNQPRIPRGMPGAGRWVKGPVTGLFRGIYRSTQGAERRPDYPKPTFKWGGVHLHGEQAPVSLRAATKASIQTDLTTRIMLKADKDPDLAGAIDAMFPNVEFPGDGGEPARAIATAMIYSQPFSPAGPTYPGVGDPLAMTKIILTRKVHEQYPDGPTLNEATDAVQKLLDEDPEVRRAFRSDSVTTAVRSLIDSWASSSWQDPRSIYVQSRVEHMFGLDDAVGIGSIRNGTHTVLTSDGRIISDKGKEDQWSTGDWAGGITPYWDQFADTQGDPLDPSVVGGMLGGHRRHEYDGYWDTFTKHDVDLLVDAYVSSTYESTQQYLRENGYTRVQVHRGVSQQALPPDYGSAEDEVLLSGQAAKDAIARAREVMLAKARAVEVIQQLQDADTEERRNELNDEWEKANDEWLAKRDAYRLTFTYKDQWGDTVHRSPVDIPSYEAVAEYPITTSEITRQVGVGKVALQPLSSFSTSGVIASGFGALSVTLDVPVERVFATALTGIGCLAEDEVVLLGGVYEADVSPTNYSYSYVAKAHPGLLVIDTAEDADWPKRTPDTLDRLPTRRTVGGLGAVQKAPARDVAGTPSAASSGHYTTPQTDLVQKALCRAWVDGFSSLPGVAKAAVDPDEILDLAAEWAKNRAGMLVQGANTTVVQSIISRSIEEGWSEAKTKRAIDRSVGLTIQGQTALFNYEKKLINDNVPPGRRQRMVDAQEKRLKAARVQTIVRNETAQAFAAGKREAWRRMRSMGEVSPYAVRIWRTHKDERTCPICGPLNGRRASLDEGRTYRLGAPDEPTAFVEGPPVHVNCRCWEELDDKGTPEIA